MGLPAILKLGGAERRKALREWTTPIFDGNRARCIDAIASSPIVGKGERQLDLRPLPSALRDALHWHVLLLIADDPANLAAVLNAVRDPVTYGTSDSTSKTGFLFGMPSEVNDETIGSIIAKYTKGESDMTTIAAMTAIAAEKTGLDLSTLIDIYDGVTVHSSHSSHDDVLVAMKAVMPSEASRIDAMSKAVLVRGARKDELKLDTAVKVTVDHVCTKLEFGAKAEAMGKLAKVGAEHEGIINAVLNVAKLPPINELIDKLNKASAELAEAKSKPASAPVVLMPAGVTVEAKAKGDLPGGKVVTRKAWEVFGMKEGGSFDFEVPVWEWDGPHPDVKPVDPNYIFREEELLSLLYSVITNERCWLHGHTGTGKTTLIEQVAARLQWPVRVVNFDSEITRMDLIGRDTLVNDGGVTTSKFIDGILPQCMVLPYFIICDELDYIRPDVSYVMQRVFEGNGLTLTEDGGRHVAPHAMFRIFATGNTQGQGDDFGMYAGARVQSMAMLDRFTAWIAVDYLPAEMRRKLLSTAVPHLEPKMADKVAQYVTEHIEAFKTAKIVKPISPRGMISLAKAIANFQALLPSGEKKKAVEIAMNRSILNACTTQDKVVLKAIIARVFA